MNILILTGSPRRKGTSNLLLENFLNGVNKEQHNIKRYDTAFLEISGCSGCYACEDGECIKNDDMKQIYEDLLKADLIVFVSPIYYYNFSAQLKTVIDRFYAIDAKLHVKKEVILLTTAYNNEKKVIKPIQVELEAICEYFGWTITGEVLALGCEEPEDIMKTKYLEDAYNLGKNITSKV